MACLKLGSKSEVFHLTGHSWSVFFHFFFFINGFKNLSSYLFFCNLIRLCSTGLKPDVMIQVGDQSFHLHKVTYTYNDSSFSFEKKNPHFSLAMCLFSSSSSFISFRCCQEVDISKLYSAKPPRKLAWRSFTTSPVDPKRSCSWPNSVTALESRSHLKTW